MSNTAQNTRGSGVPRWWQPYSVGLPVAGAWTTGSLIAGAVLPCALFVIGCVLLSINGPQR